MVDRAVPPNPVINLDTEKNEIIHYTLKTLSVSKIIKLFPIITIKRNNFSLSLLYTVIILYRLIYNNLTKLTLTCIILNVLKV